MTTVRALIAASLGAAMICSGCAYFEPQRTAYVGGTPPVLVEDNENGQPYTTLSLFMKDRGIQREDPSLLVPRVIAQPANVAPGTRVITVPAS